MQSGVMRDEIVEALRAAFPDPGDMGRVVELADIGTRFDEYRTAIGTTYPQALCALISNYADPQNMLFPLLKAAEQKNPKNDKLRAVLDKLADLGDHFASLRPDKSFGEAERIVLKGVTFEDVSVWIESLKARGRAVCRVEPQPTAETIEGYGSGFLVALDVVITNFHVARAFWDDEVKARRVVLRFGYQTDSAGIKVSEGVEYKLATAWRGPGTPDAGQKKRPWQVLSSPEDELDYALLRLDRPAGAERVDGTERGFLTPTSCQFNPEDPLLILQHPSAAPLKLAIGAVDQPDPPSHVCYKVNTEGGSSGSPCLNQRLETVALHHQGEVSRNRGVTFRAIREDWSTRLDALKAQGLFWLANPIGAKASILETRAVHASTEAGRNNAQFNDDPSLALQRTGRRKWLGRPTFVAVCATVMFLLGFCVIGWFSTGRTLDSHYRPGATYRLRKGTYVVPEMGVRIDAGATLIISAGTDLRFPAAAGLVVNGTLLVEGEKSSPVHFGPEAAGVRWRNVAFIGAESQHSVLKNCVITGGGGRRCRKDVATDRFLPDDSGTIVAGGAIQIVDSALVLEDCEISDCAACKGGAILASAGNDGKLTSLTLTRTRFTGCEASGTSVPGGGAIWAKRTAIHIEDCEFEDNKTLGNEACGGAMHLWECGDFRLVGGRFLRNRADAEGGAINAINCDSLIWISPLGLRRIEFEKNEAGGRGGAICTFNCPVRIEHADFKENAVCPIRVTSDEVFNNRTIALGGAVFVRCSMAFTTKTDQRVSACRFTDNRVKNSEPSAPGTFGGGGLCVTVDTHPDVPSTNVTIASNEFDGNKADNGPDVYLIGTAKMKGADALGTVNKFSGSPERRTKLVLEIKLLLEIH